MNINFKGIAFSAIAFVCTGVVMNSAAFGGPIGQTLQQKVSFADLNLDRPEGIAALYKRVHAAAASLCSVTESGGESLAPAKPGCVAASTSQAVAAINNAALTAYANSRGRLSSSGLVAGQP
jgi:UrcA family protein